MKKVVELLEKYVQVIAVALGALFAVAMGWRYFVDKQPKVEIGGQPVSANDLDRKILEGPAQALEQKINAGGGIEKIQVPSLSREVVETIQKTPTTQPLPMLWSDARVLSIDISNDPAIKNIVVPQFDPNNPNQPVVQGVANGPVKELATLPAAKVVGFSMGLSNVNTGMLLGAREAAMQVIPVPQPAVAGQPAQPVAPAVGPNGMPVSLVDKNWVTPSFEIQVDQLQAAMTAARIPVGLQTSFMRVEVEREELIGPGKWGNKTIVKPLAASQLAVHPLPPAGNQAQEVQYKQWADSAQLEILQPGFYPILGGSPWKPPEVPWLAPVAGPVQFNPQNFLKGPIPQDLTPEQRKAVIDARRENARLEEERKRAERKSKAGSSGGGQPGMEGEPGMGGPPPGYGGPRGPRNFAPTPPNLISMGSPVSPLMLATGAALASGSRWSFDLGEPVAMQYQPRPGFPRGGPPPGWVPPGAEDMPPEMMGDGMNPGGPAAPPAPNMGSVPGGPFDPLVWNQGNIITFVHDENVTPDKTYRYRVRYMIANPIYGQQNLAGTAGLAGQFLWTSNWSEWTADVAVPPKVTFFVANKIPSTASTVSFEVYAFINGQRKMKLVSVAPGDPIGTVDATGDYSTGYVLVDARKDAPSKENYALVMAPDGTVVRRDHTSDVGSPRYQDIKKSMPPAPGTPGAVGRGPTMGGETPAY